MTRQDLNSSVGLMDPQRPSSHIYCNLSPALYILIGAVLFVTTDKGHNSIHTSMIILSGAMTSTPVFH